MDYLSQESIKVIGDNKVYTNQSNVATRIPSLQVLPVAERPGALAWYPTGDLFENHIFYFDGLIWRPFGAGDGAILTLINVGTGFPTVPAGATTFVSQTSQNHPLPQTVINVVSTTGFPPSGTILISGAVTVTYTGITPTSFTGCSGGTGTLFAGETVSFGSSFPRFELKSIAAGTNIVITDDGSTLTVAYTGGVGTTQTLTGVGGGTFTLVPLPGTSTGPFLQMKTISPGTGIAITEPLPNTVQIAQTGTLKNGGTQGVSLVLNSSLFTTEGILAGANITIVPDIAPPNTTYYTINVLADTLSSPTLNSSLVINGSPTAGGYTINGLVAGPGVGLSTVGSDVQIANTNALPMLVYTYLTPPSFTTVLGLSTFIRISYLYAGVPPVAAFNPIYSDPTLQGPVIIYLIPDPALLAANYQMLSVDFESFGTYGAEPVMAVYTYNNNYTAQNTIAMPKVTQWVGSPNFTPGNVIATGIVPAVQGQTLPQTKWNFNNINTVPTRYAIWATQQIPGTSNTRINMQF